MPKQWGSDVKSKMWEENKQSSENELKPAFLHSIAIAIYFPIIPVIIHKICQQAGSHTGKISNFVTLALQSRNVFTITSPATQFHH